MGNNNDDALRAEASLLERRLNAIKNDAVALAEGGGGADRSNKESYRGKGFTEDAPLPDDRYSEASYRGKAGCAVSHIYGANDRLGIRRGRLTIAETPARTTVRLTILGADQRTARVELDAEGFVALKQALTGYESNRIEAPSDPPTKEDTARELLSDLAGVADQRAPMDSQQFLAAVAVGAIAARAAGMQPGSWMAIPPDNPLTPLGEALTRQRGQAAGGIIVKDTGSGPASPNGGRRSFNLDNLDEAADETDGPTQAPREDMQF